MEVVLGLPWRHVLGQLPREGAVSCLSEWVLILEPGLHLVILFVIFLVLLENFWVLSQILLVWNPRPINCVLTKVLVFEVEIDSADVIVVDSVLDVLQVVMGDWHTQLKQLFVHLLLRVLELVSQELVLMLKLLSESHLGHLVVDLGELLHLEEVLADQVLLLLGEVPQVPSWGASVDLA